MTVFRSLLSALDRLQRQYDGSIRVLLKLHPRENLDYYGTKDLKDAEKKYVKYCLNDGGYLKNIDIK